MAVELMGAVLEDQSFSIVPVFQIRPRERTDVDAWSRSCSRCIIAGERPDAERDPLVHGLVDTGAVLGREQVEEEPSGDGQPQAFTIDRIEVATIGPGDTAGELALITRGPRMATVITTTRVVAEVIYGPDFRTIIERAPGFSRALLHQLARRNTTAGSDERHFISVGADDGSGQP